MNTTASSQLPTKPHELRAYCDVCAALSVQVRLAVHINKLQPGTWPAFLSSKLSGETVLRDYINATVWFTELAQVMHRSPKSLMRMLGPKGNPQAQKLFQIVAYLMSQEGVRFKLRTAKA